MAFRSHIWSLMALLPCVVASLVGCQALRSKGRGPALHGREFLLQSAEGAELLAGARVKVGFSADVVSIAGGCNLGSGNYHVDSGRLVLTSLMSSLMGCEQIEHDRDRWLSEFFSAKPRIEQDGMRLILSDGKARLVFLDRVQADPDRPLQATAWEVSIYVDGETGMGLLGITSPRLVFLEDGSFTLRASCREGNGTYEVTESRGATREASKSGHIIISRVAFREAPCAEDNDRTAGEFVRSVFKMGKLEYRIKGRALTLSGQPRGLELYAVE